MLYIVELRLISLLRQARAFDRCVNWVWQGMAAAMPWFQARGKRKSILLLAAAVYYFLSVTGSCCGKIILSTDDILT